MADLSNNEKALLNMVCHMNDAMKYLNKALKSSLPDIKSNPDFEKFSAIQEQTDGKVKRFLSVLGKYQ